ncbi:AAA family ATPase [Magnetovibrio sp. PR-2]|uniref:AAA family ATPase n=1 Tax=Magnetovibrio sp. PR-2 TaxID=3120356 RepID=UPI002FCDE6AF
MSDYFNIRVLGADDRASSSIIGHVAYTSRSRMHDPVLEELGGTKHTFDFSDRKDELYTSVLLMPPHAPETLKNNPEIVWGTAQEAEVAKSTGQYRKNAQLAKCGTVHFNRVSRVSLWGQVACLEAFCKQQFVDPGLVVQIDVHPYGSPLYPDQNDEDQTKISLEFEHYPNTKIIDVSRIPDEPLCDTEHILRLSDGRHFIYMPHAHLTISTRTVTPDGFSKRKARHLNPSFANGRVIDGDDWTDQWVLHQNEWYSARSVSARVVKTSSYDRKYVGKAHNTAAGLEEAEVIRVETLRRLQEEPDFLLDLALEHQATFSVQDLRYILRRAGMTPREAQRYADIAFERSDVIKLHDVMTSKVREIYTRTDVRHQERLVLQLTDAIKARRFSIKEEAFHDAIASRTMNAEQVEAFRRHVSGDGITFTQGRAGAGKSYMLGAVREAHEASGYDVIGLAPTNSVASDMKEDGFAAAATVHVAVFRGEKGKLDWNEHSLVIVDEAGMLDTEVTLKLLNQVAKSGAKLVMVGDDRQLSSVRRGGMWPLMTDRHDTSLMNQINRQVTDCQKSASIAFSEGRVGDAIRAYDDQGYVHWNGNLDQALGDLLQKFEQDLEMSPDMVRFIYVSTNTTVNTVNAEVHGMRVRRGEVTNIHEFKTERGPILMGIGDRIQFYENQKQDGIINGLMGIVISVLPEEIQVKTDSGEHVSINPTEYQNFGHGYAGTVYRGQGKTVGQSYCLYDNKFAWSAKSAYVAMTRHKKQVDLFVPRDLAPDFEHLVRQVSREGRDGASLNWATEAEMVEFRHIAKTNSSPSEDPYKTTWGKLWADFVVRTTDTVSLLTDTAQTAIREIVSFYKPKKTRDDDAFDTEQYHQKMRKKPRYNLIDEFNSLAEQIELTERPDARRVALQKKEILEDIASSNNLDLSDDPRIAIAKKRDVERRDAIKQAQNQGRQKG